MCAVPRHPVNNQKARPKLEDVKPSRQWILYTVLRFGLFVVVLAGLMLLGLEPWVAAIIAAVVGLCVTYIFFRGQRDDVARSFYRWRTTEHRDEDSEIENEALDAVVSEPGRPAAEPENAAGDWLEGDRRREGHSEQERREAR